MKTKNIFKQNDKRKEKKRKHKKIRIVNHKRIVKPRLIPSEEMFAFSPDDEGRVRILVSW